MHRTPKDLADRMAARRGGAKADDGYPGEGYARVTAASITYLAKTRVRQRHSARLLIQLCQPDAV